MSDAGIAQATERDERSEQQRQRRQRAQCSTHRLDIQQADQAAENAGEQQARQ